MWKYACNKSSPCVLHHTVSLLVSVKQAKCKSTFFLPVFQVACCVLASQPSSASTTLKRPSEWRAWYLREWSSPPGITTDYIQVCRCMVLVIYASSIVWPTGQMSCSHINKRVFFVFFPLEIHIQLQKSNRLLPKPTDAGGEVAAGQFIWQVIVSAAVTPRDYSIFLYHWKGGKVVGALVLLWIETYSIFGIWDLFIWLIWFLKKRNFVRWKHITEFVCSPNALRQRTYQAM